LITTVHQKFTTEPLTWFYNPDAYLTLLKMYGFKPGFIDSTITRSKKSSNPISPVLAFALEPNLLAHLLEATVRKNPVAEIGAMKQNLLLKGKRIHSLRASQQFFPYFHWHADTFDVPRQARLLVEGEDCRNQAFRFQNILGLQFHLEITLEQLEKWLEEYADELKLVNKTRDQAIHEYRTREKVMVSLAYKLLDNFFKATGV